MSDLIKRIDEYMNGDSDESRMDILDDCKAALEAKGEPVLYVSPDDLANELFVGMNAVRKVHQDFGKHYTVPLYTTPPNAVAWIEKTKYGTGFRFDERLLQAYPNFPNPPSVDALIAELGQLQTPILVSEMDAVLDKYRSAK